MRRRQLPYPVVRRIVQVVQRPGLGGPLPVRVQRRYLEVVSTAPPAPRDTRTEAVTVAGVPGLRVTVGEPREQAAIIHLHGGAYTVGSPRIYRNMAANLAELTGRAVYLPHYRLAPEHQYPAALEDAEAVCREVAREHGEYVLSGDSAGGGLAAATALRLAGTDAHPARLGLIAPWVDLTVVPPAIKTDIVVRAKWGRASAEKYCGEHDRFDPGISPIFGDLATLPPALLQVGRDEVLLEQCLRFARKAQAAGADLTVHESPRLWHVAHLHADLLAEAHDWLRELADFLATGARPAADPPPGA